jgi:rare lipoprotein A
MSLPNKVLVISGIGALLAGCAGVGSRTAEQPQDRLPSASAEVAQPTLLPPFKGGGYYKDDGPGANPPPNLHAVPDAVPRQESLHRFANDAYRVKGRRYVPDTSGEPYRERGLASWYGRKFHDRPTSSGEPYDMYAMTAAHKTLPIPSYARVTNPENGRSIVVRINDRGPFHPERIIDLSYTGAYKLDLLKGVSMVEVERLFPDAGDAPTSFAAGALEEGGKVMVAALSRPEMVERPLPAAEPARGAGVLYLQLGAFASPEAAESLMARVAQDLGRQVPGVLRQEAGGLIKVQAGPYADAAEADQAARHLAERLGVKPYKVSVRRDEPAPPAAPSPARDGETVAPPAPAHWLQLAAYGNPQSAERLYDQFRTRADLPGLEKVADAGLIKIQAGPYANAALADQAALVLADALGHKPYRLVR